MTSAATTPPIKPCWLCHWYGYMLDDDAAACVNPAGQGVRPAAVHGCSMWVLEPVMDTGEVPPRPPPTSPTSATGRRVAAERDRLVELHLQLGFDKASWQPRRQVVHRSGELSRDEQ